MKNGWGKVKAIAHYAGISQRTLRDWLKKGLRHSRLPSGAILIQYAAVDQFLTAFEVEPGSQIDQIVDEVFARNTK